MLIDYNSLEETVIHEFKGGTGDTIMQKYDDGQVKVMKVTLKKGCSIGEHTHVDNCETIYVISGAAKITCNGETEIVKAGQSHFCPKGGTHHTEQYGEEDLVMSAVVPAMDGAKRALLERRSCRDFKPDMVEKDKIEAIVKAGTYAPTGMNRQAPIIIAVTNKEIRDKFMRLNASILGRDGDPFYGAPVVLIVLVDKNASPTWSYDGPIVMQNMMLMAHDLGLGSCWIHRAKEEFQSLDGKMLLKALGIEGDYEGVGHCVIGYPASEPMEASERKENYVYWVE